MSKVLILYYSSYGHIETLAGAIAEGVREGGAEAVIKRVPETVADEVAAAAYFKTDQTAPVCTVDELPEYDAIILGSPTRYGRMSSQMAAFLDQTGPLWARGALNGKVGGAFVSTGSQHGGQETTLFSLITNLMPWGSPSSACPIASRASFGLTRSAVVRPMARRRSRAARASASRRRMNWRARGTRAR